MNPGEERWRQSILPEQSTVEQVIRNLERVAIKIVLIVNERAELQGTISDGDIRRGLLKGLTLASPITTVIHRNPMVVPPEMGREMVMRLMVANKIQQIPVVDELHHVLGLHLWDEIAAPAERANLMVIMAGGMGTRLHPHTRNCPKPMLPVAGKPMLEHIIERAKLEGFRDFVLAINWLGHMVENHFGDGAAFGVRIRYLREQSALGTAGALSLLSPLPQVPFVVTNGDVIADIRYGELLEFHIRYDAAATMAVRAYEWQHPFGVVRTQGANIIGFEEKPVVRSHINAGVYALSPEALGVLSPGAHCDMPMVFSRLQENGARTVAYPIHEPWLDVGRPDDWQQANAGMTEQAP